MQLHDDRGVGALIVYVRDNGCSVIISVTHLEFDIVVVPKKGLLGGAPTNFCGTHLTLC